MILRKLNFSLLLFCLFCGCSKSERRPAQELAKEKNLSSIQKQVCLEAGTEAPFTGKWLNHKKQGIYTCAVCGHPLFSSSDKFNSGTGWPSFTRPQSLKSVDERDDSHFGLSRTEIVCSNCKAHLGHVFSDGPAPTGLRYCINSVCLDFKEADNPQENKGAAAH